MKRRQEAEAQAKARLGPPKQRVEQRSAPSKRIPAAKRPPELRGGEAGLANSDASCNSRLVSCVSRCAQRQCPSLAIRPLSALQRRFPGMLSAKIFLTIACSAASAFCATDMPRLPCLIAISILRAFKPDKRISRNSTSDNRIPKRCTAFVEFTGIARRNHATRRLIKPNLTPSWRSATQYSLTPINHHQEKKNCERQPKPALAQIGSQSLRPHHNRSLAIRAPSAIERNFA